VHSKCVYSPVYSRSCRNGQSASDHCWGSSATGCEGFVKVLWRHAEVCKNVIMLTDSHTTSTVCNGIQIRMLNPTGMPYLDVSYPILALPHQGSLPHEKLLIGPGHGPTVVTYCCNPESQFEENHLENSMHRSRHIGRSDPGTCSMQRNIWDTWDTLPPVRDKVYGQLEVSTTAINSWWNHRISPKFLGYRPRLRSSDHPVHPLPELGVFLLTTNRFRGKNGEFLLVVSTCFNKYNVDLDPLKWDLKPAKIVIWRHEMLDKNQEAHSKNSESRWAIIIPSRLRIWNHQWRDLWHFGVSMCQIGHMVQENVLPSVTKRRILPISSSLIAYCLKPFPQSPFPTLPSLVSECLFLLTRSLVPVVQVTIVA